MQDNEVEAAKLLAQMGTDPKAKLPSFMLKAENISGAMESKQVGGHGTRSTNRPRGSSFDALTATVKAAMGEMTEGLKVSESTEALLPLPPMPNKMPGVPLADGDGNSSGGSGSGSGGGDSSSGIAAGTQRRTASGRPVVPDFANFATGGVVMPPPGPPSNPFKDMGGAQFDSFRRASRGSSVGSDGCSGYTSRNRASTISDAPSMSVDRMDKVGIYGPEERKARIARFLEKRRSRVWAKKVKYDVRKNFADSRMRVKGRFVKKEDEAAYQSEVPETAAPKARSRSNSTSSAGKR
jgi:hypothetical protein